MILLTTPSRSVWHEFSTKACWIRYMPVWPREEIVKCHQLLFPRISKDTANERFRRWHPALFEEAFPAIYTVDDLLDACRKLDIGEDPAAHTLLHECVGDDFLDDPFVFASEYVRDVVCRIRIKDDKERLFKILAAPRSPRSSVSQFQVFRGHLFEAHVHAVLPRGGTFRIRRLVHLEENKITWMSMWGDDGSYYRQAITMFHCCVDALAKRIRHVLSPEEEHDSTELEMRALRTVIFNDRGKFKARRTMPASIIGHPSPLSIGRRPCTQEGLRDAVILLWFSDTPKRLDFVVPTEKFDTYQDVGNATTHSEAKMCEIQQLHFLNSERSLAVMHKRVDEDDARDTTAELGAAVAIGAADGDADSKVERIAASGSSSGFRKFRHLLMAKHFESRDNTPLFIGSFGAANNRDALQTHGISHILCVSPTLPLPYVDGLIYHHIDMNMNAITGGMHRLRRFPDAFTYLRIAVADLPSVRISESFPLALDFIDSAVLKGGCVLVHCFVGKSRSATLVLAYLVARKQMRLEAALALLRRLRPETQPNSGFLAELALWEQQQLQLQRLCE
ncbi:Crinkler, partial [Globisporangium splendens]